MATYGVRFANINTGVKNVALKGLTKEQAEMYKDNLKAVETDEVKVQIFIEMNKHEEQVDRLIQKAVSEYIGGYENMLLDYPEGSEEAEEAKAILNHDTLFELIYDDVMAESQGNYASHIRFAGKMFIEERIERRLAKEGYGA